MWRRTKIRTGTKITPKCDDIKVQRDEVFKTQLFKYEKQITAIASNRNLSKPLAIVIWHHWGFKNFCSTGLKCYNWYWARWPKVLHHSDQETKIDAGGMAKSTRTGRKRKQTEFWFSSTGKKDFQKAIYGDRIVETKNKNNEHTIYQNLKTRKFVWRWLGRDW